MGSDMLMHLPTPPEYKIVSGGGYVALYCRQTDGIYGDRVSEWERVWVSGPSMTTVTVNVIEGMQATARNLGQRIEVHVLSSSSFTRLRSLYGDKDDPLPQWLPKEVLTPQVELLAEIEKKEAELEELRRRKL